MKLKRLSNPRRLVVAFSVSILIGFSLPSTIHRRAFDDAFFHWYKNPTPATAAALEGQRYRNAQIAFETQASCTVLLFIVIYTVWALGDSLSKRP
ncbi:MAG: hypothetical protein JOZ10_18220 [Acidobacteria bacterium]|nr:hypothetical protein [Acidobacteriota bacterium]MBV9144559.1 hypothetical protein [Acidobacteriota bacterium]